MTPAAQSQSFPSSADPLSATDSPQTATSLPLLTPRHAHVVNALFSYCGDIHALAASEKLSASDLIAFSSDPAVQQHIAALHQLHEAGLALAAASAKRTALNTLEELARTAEDPIERRRAAAAIIRPGSTRDITRPFAQSDDADPDDDQDLDEDMDDESDSSVPSDPSVPSVPSDDPNAEVLRPHTPHPRHSDRDPIDAAVEALKKPRNPASACAPYFFFLKDATACGLPLPKNADDYHNHFAALFGHADKLVNEQRHFCHPDRLAPNDSSYSLTFQSEDGRTFEYYIELHRPDYDDEYPKCWRIKTLNWVDRLDHVDPKRRAKLREAAKAPAPDSS